MLEEVCRGQPGRASASTDPVNPKELMRSRRGFSAALEREARINVDRHPADDHSDFSVTDSLVREIALVLDQLDSLRDLDDSQRLSLLRVECYTNTELMQMEQRTPRYSPHRFPEREKFQRSLLRIEQDRRRLADTAADRERHLHDRLLSLVERFRLLAS